MLVVRGTIFTMFGINTIFLSPSLEAKFDRKVCPSAKLTRGEPWWLLGLCHVSLVNWERPCPPLPVLHSWTFRWPTELAGGLKGGTEVAATLTLHSWGWAGCPSGLEGHHGCNFSSSLGCSQSLSPSTSHSYWAKSVCCCTEKCNRSSAGYLVHPSCRLASRKRQTHVPVCSGEFQLSLADLRRLPLSTFLSDSPAYPGPAPGTGPAAFQTASLPAPHRLDSP